MQRKLTIPCDDNSYLLRIKYGKKGRYIERVIKERLGKLNYYFTVLKNRKYKKKDIIDLIKDLSLPVGTWEKKNPNLGSAHKEALIALWEEVSETGISTEELLDILDNLEGGRDGKKSEICP